MKFKQVKRFLALSMAAMAVMSMPMEASAAGLHDIFDAKYYADCYPDLKAAFGYDERALYNHFLKYGLKEGRNMNPVLDVVSYRESYQDLDTAFGENWDAYVNHFLTYGVKEKNRRKGVLMDPIAYSEAYGDIKEAFGDDLLAVIKHYEETGYTEKRTEGTSKGHSDIAEAKAAEQAPAPAPSKPASSSQPSVSAPETETPVTDGYTVMKDANGNVYDLGGKTFKIYSWWQGDFANDEGRADYRAWAQETYNFKMEWSGDGDWGVASQLGEIATGGLEGVNNEYRAYIAPSGQMKLISAAKEGLLWDINSLGVIDFSEPRYALNGIADMYKIGDGVYAMSSEAPEPRDGVWFNKELLEKTTGMTADDLYDLQKSNQWTWAKFEEICQKVYEGGDLDKDGVQDVYALAANSGLLQTCFCASNNVQMFGFKDGKYVYQAEDPAVIEAFDEFLKVYRADYYYSQPEDMEWDYFYQAFDEEGKLVFLPEQAYHVTNGQRFDIHDETNAGTYGFLMFPIGPNANGQFVNRYQDNIIFIPKCYSEQEAREIALAYSIWYADVPGYSRYNSRLEVFAPNCSDTRMVNETLLRMMSEGGMVVAPGVPGISVGEDIACADGRDAEWWPDGLSAAEMIASCSSDWQAKVAAANE